MLLPRFDNAGGRWYLFVSKKLTEDIGNVAKPAVPNRGKISPQGGNLGVSGGNYGQAGNFQKFRTALIIELGFHRWVF